MRKGCLFLMLLLSMYGYSQKYDYRWILGYRDIGNGNNGNTDVVFTDTSADTLDYQRLVNMQNGQTTISDSAGNLLFFTNCARIYNRNDSIMKNGDSLNYGPAWSNLFYGLAYNALEDIVALPSDTPAIWNLIHYYDQYNEHASPGFYSWRILQSRIDMRGDSGQGEVVFKNKILVEDTISPYVAACQHANGRDWWVLSSKSSSNCFYQFLVQPDTVIQYPMQCIGRSYVSGDAGQAAFSPDGTKFAWVGGDAGISVYDFDRCSGLLSNPEFLPFYRTVNTNVEFGLSFSPNSKILYATQSTYIFQFDLTATDIAASVDTVGRLTLPPDSNSFIGYYFLMQLAPDGKIYISANNGIKYLHVINNPDNRGDSCNFVNYGFKLPRYNSFGLPSYPGNYRLGRLRGSECDTIYTDTDTTHVELVTISAREKILKIFPNPAKNYVIIDYGFTDWSRGGVSMEIMNELGQMVHSQQLPMYSGFQKMDVSNYASGMYTVYIKRNTQIVATSKFIKQ